MPIDYNNVNTPCQLISLQDLIQSRLMMAEFARKDVSWHLLTGFQRAKDLSAATSKVLLINVCRRRLFRQAAVATQTMETAVVVKPQFRGKGLDVGPIASPEKPMQKAVGAVNALGVGTRV